MKSSCMRVYQLWCSLSLEHLRIKNHLENFLLLLVTSHLSVEA